MNLLKAYLILVLFIFLNIPTFSQTTNIVILNQEEIGRLREQIKSNHEVGKLYTSILKEAQKGLNDDPRAIEKIYYEGLLETNPKRVETVKSFADIDYVIQLIYASYGKDNPEFGKKARQIILDWTRTYIPTGNPINENKFNAFYWGYFRFKDHFSKKEQLIVEDWFLRIATKEMNREHTPNNNWEAKRCKMIGIIGCILNNEELKTYSINGFKKYISTAYYKDGTSRDLKQRDALHYHVSGLKPCVSAFINLSQFDSRFDLYDFVSNRGSSIQKSVEYVVPYAKGDKQRQEWRNTKVKLDKERAAAGLEEYRPGKLFEPEKAYSLFEVATFYNADWIMIYEKGEDLSSWLGVLNSPPIRKNF